MEWLNYHHLHYFWYVAREESISRASEHLHLAPSTISAQVTKLEETLGTKLFLRVGRNLELTDMGRMVFRYADEIFSLGLEMLDTVRRKSTTGPLRLVVGIVDVLPKLVIRKLLEPVLALPEQVHLICQEGKDDQLVAELAIHSLDIVLTDTPAKPGLSVQAYSHLLGESSIGFYATPELANKVRPGFPHSLSGAPMLLPGSLSVLRGSLDRWFETMDIRPFIVGEFDDQALLNIFGQAGDGIFAAPTFIEKEIKAHYGVEFIGLAGSVKEQFYAISVERIIKHPVVMTISETAHKTLLPDEMNHTVTGE